TSCIRRAVNEFPKLAEIKLITSGLYLLPINEENLALKKHRLPEASLRLFSRRRKFLGVGLLIKCNQAWSFQIKTP
ncbi:hypothetical protein Avbf_13721, partial [Armadillidium vulgare]